MKTAVTGGSGVVGKAVVRHLIDSGHQVRALGRSDDSATVLGSLGASPVRGDLMDVSALDDLARGADWVFHIGGVNELCSRDPAGMWRVNVEGTMLALEASARAGVRRFVHTSSAVTVGEAHGTIGTEESPHRGHFLSGYERSKHQAERLLFERHHDVEVVAVNPSSVQGPGRSTGSGALLLEAARGRLPFLVDTTLSLVDIDDCAKGHVLAAERGRDGERYLLSGGSVSVRQVVSVLSRLSGRRWSPLYLRPGLVTAMAPVVELVARVVGKQTPICPESARVLLNGHRYDGAKATRDLGLSYTPIEHTLERAVAWFGSEGLL